VRNIKEFELFEDSAKEFISSVKRERGKRKPTEELATTLRNYLNRRDGIDPQQQTGQQETGSLADILVGKMSNRDEIEDLDLQTKLSPVVGKVDPKGLSGDKKKNAQLVVDALKKYGIVNPLTQKAILSVIGKESNFIPKDEISYKNTSNERIRKIFGSKVKDLSDDELNRIKKTDEFWDVVYGGRYGNDSPGDGAKYRGRGFNGLTFKGNYEKYNNLLKQHGTNVDIVRNPEMANDPEIAAELNALYFLDRLSSKHSKRKFGNDDPNDFTKFEDALGAAVNANAGWGKDITGSRAWRHALAYSSRFEIGDYSNLA
jgi:putative chitinase